MTTNHSAPITPPVPHQPKWLLELIDNGSPIPDQLADIKHDSPQDYRDSKERRKKPWRPDDPIAGAR